MKKIVIDTTVLITFLISDTVIIKEILELQNQGLIEIYHSTELFNELQNTIKKPSLKIYLEPVKSKLSRFIAWYKYNTRRIIVDQRVAICRDPKDDILLELAKQIEADYIITGDKDLLVLDRFENCKIVTPRTFIESINRNKD